MRWRQNARAAAGRGAGRGARERRRGSQARSPPTTLGCTAPRARRRRSRRAPRREGARVREASAPRTGPSPQSNPTQSRCRRSPPQAMRSRMPDSSRPLRRCRGAQALRRLQRGGNMGTFQSRGRVSCRHSFGRLWRAMKSPIFIGTSSVLPAIRVFGRAGLRTRGVNRHGDSQRPLHARRAVSERDVSARPVCGVGLDQGRCERVGRAAPAPRATVGGVTPFGGSTGRQGDRSWGTS